MLSDEKRIDQIMQISSYLVAAYVMIGLNKEEAFKRFETEVIEKLDEGYRREVASMIFTMTWDLTTGEL